MELNNSKFEGVNQINQDITSNVSIDEIAHETTPEQDAFEMKKAFAQEKGISVDDVLEVNGHFIVSENATTVHTKDDGTVN